MSDHAVTVSFAGVAADTAGAQAQLGAALEKAGLRVASLSFDGVSPAPAPTCTLLDAYRQMKAPQTGDITSDQAKYEMSYQTEGGKAGQVAAVPQIHISAQAMRGNLVLSGIDPDGFADSWIQDAGQLRDSVQGNPTSGSINADGSTTLKATQTTAGLVGVVLFQGSTPIDPALVAPPPQARDAAWRGRLLASAKAGAWTAQIAWFRIVNELPDVAAPPPAGPGLAPPQAVDPAAPR